MSNGHDMMEDWEFKEMISRWTPAEQFLAEQVREININCPKCQEQLVNHEKRLTYRETMLPLGKKQVMTTSSISGGIVAFFVSIIIGLIEYFRTRGA